MGRDVRVDGGQCRDDRLLRAALALLGEGALVELVALAGYYSLSSFLLNTFRVPLPEGVRVPWDPAQDAP